MATVHSTSTTTEELLAMPDNGVERWLIAQELSGEPHLSGFVLPVRLLFE